MAFLEKVTNPVCQIDQVGELSSVLLTGDWVVNTLAKAEEALADIKSEGRSIGSIDLSGVAGLDTSGAWLVHRLKKRLSANGPDVSVVGLDDKRTALLVEIAEHDHKPLSRSKSGYSLVRFLEVVGRQTVGVWHDMLAMLDILGSLGTVLATVLVQPKRLRSISVAVQFDKTCIGAVPIVALMSFLIGAIVSQQGGFYLRQFGVEIYVVDLAGVLVLREIGVILTAIMVAGRSGSAFTAEIGAMRMREEVDALHVIGMSVTEVLILPRILALMIAIPVLTFVADIASLVGSGLVAWGYLGIAPQAFITLLHVAISAETLLVGLIKAPFMALIVGLIACVEGMKVGGSTESLGRHTTMSVVKAIFLVIVVDGLFAIFFAAIGI